MKPASPHRSETRLLVVFGVVFTFTATVLPFTKLPVRATIANGVRQQQTPNKNAPAANANENKDAPISNANDNRSQCTDNVQRLSAEVQRLRKRVTDLEKYSQVNTIQDQLTKEEQRGEALQMRLIDIGEKEGNLQRSLDQVNIQLRPEKIESALVGFGSVRPEELREELRRRLTNEKLRIQSQLDLVRQDKTRTQASLTTVDTAIQRLRQRLAEVQRR